MSEWTTDTLKQYVDAIFAERMIANDLAAADIDRRLEGMNEFREQLNRERTDYVTTDVYEGRHLLLEERIDSAVAVNAARLLTVERWQAKIIGALGLVMVLLPPLTATVFYLLENSKHH